VSDPEDRSPCPPRVKLLALIAAGEYVPHLEMCEDCAAFVAAATEAVSAFNDRRELEVAVALQVDAVLAEKPARHWSSVIAAAPDLRRSVVVRDLLRRADDAFGSDARLTLDLTMAAVAVCDAMVASGNPPSMDLQFLALKEHSTALYRMGDLNQAISVINRAWPIATRTGESQRDRAILSLCAAILYSQPDIARFDDAIELAETAASVLDICGDERRANLARQTKAQILMVLNRYTDALPLLRTITFDLDEATGESRDSATAYALLALCLAHVRARAVAGIGRFAEVRAEFHRAAAVIFAAKHFDVWLEMRLDYVAAALADDASADVRAELESVVHVCATLSATESTQRRIFAAEATDYLRQLAVRDALTCEAAKNVRAFIARNSSRPPVKFVRPPGLFIM
jgi:tetratricopeptide (TPR) repeat protein